MKKALITGISGQDGSYLAEFLLDKNYEVHGIIRRVALEDETHRLWRLRKIRKKLILHSGSLESYASLIKIVDKIKPDEIYHLAAQSYVSYSFEDEFSTLNTNINGTHYMLSAVKEFSKDSKFYFAGTSEMFGKVNETPQNEDTKFHPRSAYGISKVTGFEMTRNYREAYDIKCCTGILFNHESPRRGFEFVTRKISLAVARIKLGLQKELFLGNINSKRDWGHAKDYVRAMWLMLNKNKGLYKDYVIGTGVQHSVEEFASIAFKFAKLNYKDYVKVDQNLLRPSEVETLFSDYSTVKKELGWSPEIKFEDLVNEMVEEDLKFVKDSSN